MNRYVFLTLIKDERKRYREVLITFSHSFPKEHGLWQDSRFGSVFVMNAGYPSQPKREVCLSVIEEINVRHACWSYLKNRNLLKENNVHSINHHLPRG